MKPAVIIISILIVIGFFVLKRKKTTETIAPKAVLLPARYYREIWRKFATQPRRMDRYVSDKST